MRLVNHRFRPRAARTRRAAEGLVREVNDRFRDVGRAVDGAGVVACWRAGVANRLFGRGPGAVERTGVRVGQQLGGIEPVALLRRERPVRAKTVKGAWLQTGNEAMPDGTGAVGQRHAGDFLRAVGAEKA